MRRHAKVAAATIGLVAVAALVLLPLYVALSAASASPAALARSGALHPGSAATLARNVGALFGAHSEFARWMANSVVYSAGSAAVATYLSALIGYALALHRFAGRRWLGRLLVGGLMVPSTALAVPLFVLESRVGLTNTAIGVFLPLCVFPFGSYFLWSYARSVIPVALVDAARIDGASEVYIVHRIGLRLMPPGLATVFAVAYVAASNNYLLPLILLTSRRLFPVSLGLAESGGALSPQTGAGLVVAIIPALIVFSGARSFLGRPGNLGALATGPADAGQW